MGKINERDLVRQFLLKSTGATSNKLLNERIDKLKSLQENENDIESSSDVRALAMKHESIEKIAIECLSKNLIDERSTLFDIIQICMDKNDMSQDDATEAIMVTLKKAIDNYKILIS